MCFWRGKSEREWVWGLDEQGAPGEGNRNNNVNLTSQTESTEVWQMCSRSGFPLKEFREVAWCWWSLKNPLPKLIVKERQSSRVFVASRTIAASVQCVCMGLHIRRLHIQLWCISRNCKSLGFSRISPKVGGVVRYTSWYEDANVMTCVFRNDVLFVLDEL